MSSPQVDAAAPAEVRVVDQPSARVHHPADLVGAILSVVAIAAVVVRAVYAQGTTTGITEDVRGFASLLRRILFVPVTVLEGLITVLAPVAVLTELFLRRLGRQAVEALVAAVLGVLAALLAVWLVRTIGTDDLRNALSVWIGGERTVTIPALLTGTAALLTAAGARNRRRTLPASWNLLWIALGVALVTGIITLPGAMLTVLIGRFVGQATRFISGVQSERAYGEALLDGIRRAGFEPRSVVRVRDLASGDPTSDQAEPAALAITRTSDNRVYAVTTTEGERLDVVVLDGDRQVVGALARFWRSLRLRGIDGRAVVSLRQAAERAALLSHAAWSAGVCTPRLLGLAESEDSMLLVQQHAQGAVPLVELPVEALTDDVLDAVWEQLRVAHAAGLAHRALTADVVLISRDPDVCSHASADHPASRASAMDTGDPLGPGPVALLTAWESGDVASSDLARRVDVSQMLALLALRVGAERAVESASRVLPDHELTRIGPLLQSIALPRATRDEARQHKGVLQEVREALLARLPETVVEPERLVRFGGRTILTIVLAVGAAFAIITTLNFQQITVAFRTAEPWWAAIAFALGLVTFLGSALSLVAFAPMRLPLWRATLVQVAGAYAALVAPAGIGPAALNLRMLTRRGAPPALAAASVALVQVSQLITTVALLVVLSLVSGTPRALQLPSTTVLAVLAALAVIVVVTLLVPPARQWIGARARPIWEQTWPRLIQLMGRPKRLALAVVGNLIMTLGYLGAFYACLAAFDRELALIDLALIYLIANAIGAAAPTPGGLGAIEGALIAALAAPPASLPAAIGAAVVVLFRALTYWGRVPLGYAATRYLQRVGEL